MNRKAQRQTEVLVTYKSLHSSPINIYNAARPEKIPKPSETSDIYSTLGPSSNRHHHQSESGVQRGVVGTAVLPGEITAESWQTGQTVPKQPDITSVNLFIPLLLLPTRIPL